MSKISIHVALSLIDQAFDDQGEPIIFSLDYYKSDGTRGSIRKAQKKRPASGAAVTEQGTVKERAAWNHHMKESGTLLLYSLDKESSRQIIIPLITKYNGIKVDHQ